MKRYLFLAVLFVMVPQILMAQVGSLEFNSSSYMDYPIPAEEFDPQIVIDENNENYDLIFTQMAGPYLYQPYPVLATQNQMGWSTESLVPSGPNYDYLQAQLQIAGTDEVMCTRRYSDFSANNFLILGDFYTFINPDNLSQEYGNQWSNDLLSSRDYLNSATTIHYLSNIVVNDVGQFDYYERDSNGNYTRDANIYSSGQLKTGLSDMTIGYNDTPYFCFRDGNNLRVLSYEGDPVTIASLYSAYTGNWNNKLLQFSPPSIAYNPSSGVAMVAYTDYDDSEGLWRLYFSTKPNGSNQWSTPQLIYENSVNLDYPSVVPDNSGDDFLVAFYSIESNDHVRLNTIRYSEERETFWDTPIYVSDLGNKGDSGHNLYYGRPLDVKVLPWENTTALLISTITFESGTDTDVKLYSVDVPTTSNYTFRNIVLDEDAGGSLKLTNLATQSAQTFTSGSSRTLNLDTDYSIETLPGRFDNYDYNGQLGDYQHHDWDRTNSSYHLIDEFTARHDVHVKNAYYQEIVSITLNCTDELEIDDPWYFDPSTHAQTDGFRTISSGSHDAVFLNQNPDFEPSKPIYSLRAPLLVAGDPGEYHIFRRWIGTHVNFGNGGITNDRETPVVFTAAGANATAQYNTLTINAPLYGATVYSEGETVYLKTRVSSFEQGEFTKVTVATSGGVTLIEQGVYNGYLRYRVSMTANGSVTMSYLPIQSGDDVFVTSDMPQISAGTTIDMPSGSSITMLNYSRFQGTANQPITFRGVNGTEWNGLKLSEMSTGSSLENIVIKNTTIAMTHLPFYGRCVIRNVVVDSADYGVVSNVSVHYTGGVGSLSIDNCVFNNIDSAGVFSAADEYYLADTLRVTNCSFSPATAGHGNAIQVVPLPFDEHDHFGEFKSIQIENNVIYEFASGIEMEIGDRHVHTPDLDWEVDLNRVVLTGNRIENCSNFGVKITGEHALFAHHNILTSCGTGYYIKASPQSGSPQYESHRILNETIVGNSLGADLRRNGLGTIGHIGASILWDNSVNLNLDGDFREQGNLTENPLFVDYNNGDYHLTSSSPAIDAGWEDFDGNGSTWETDADDQDPDGTRMDMGALYYDPAPQAPYLTLDVSGFNPVLNWELTATSSGYPDRDIDRFRIYKHYFISRFNQQTSYATVNDGEATSYTDYGFGLNFGTSTATYKVQAIDNLDQSSAWSNSRNTTGMVAMKPTVLPDKYQLGNAYPNPFNPSTTLEYGVPVNGNVEIRIYDMVGRLVYQEITVNQLAGWYSLVWQGKDIRGNQVPSGVYLISLTAQGTETREGYDGEMNFSQVQKVILMK
ncbi:MAG: hypothetical protein AUJ47_09890 [Candidatus Marinimicrobia bacterium CG1_02_48_14]|nr:MAG: hypothetical protein AUJ47_09890 [Candidatus Marinimicrobia bacterium CG1_02_48_14]